MGAFTSVMDEMQFIPAAKDLGLEQYRRRLSVTAPCFRERFPYRICDPRLLFSLMAAWLDDTDRELFDELGINEADPEWDVSVDSEETATVLVSVPMVEELVLIPDENGPIPWQGQRWRLADPEIWTAFSAQIFGADNTGAPVGDT